MTDNSLPSALKHGAFSEILILPGEDPQDFENLKNGLFAEYKPSGISEERLMMAIARALWQERRLALYQHVQHARIRKSSPDDGGNAMAKALHEFRVKHLGWSEPFVPKPIPVRTAEERAHEALLELGHLLTLDQLEKELDVESKLQSKIDRLFKRFFQMKAMKQIAGLGEPPASSLNGATPVLQLAAADPTKPLEE
jgi:hypothetical protein